jgi:hypothetical protein
MPLAGVPFVNPAWNPKVARVGPTLLAANNRVQDQLRTARNAVSLRNWPAESRSGLALQVLDAASVQLTAGTHLDATGVAWSWPTQAVALPDASLGAVLFLCAGSEGQLQWHTRVPATALTVLGYVLRDETGVVSLRAIRPQVWLEHDATGTLLKAYEGLHDWIVREEFYRYDDNGRIREIVAIEPDKTHTSRYAFDAEGRLITVKRSTTKTEPFLFNGLYRLNGALFWRGTV